MTDAAFAEARHYCIRDHIVVEDGCSLTGLHSRVPPSRAIELTPVFLDRKVAAILARPLKLKAAASAQQKRELAAIIHLCGASSAKAFARRGFHPIAGERCGDQEVATYPRGERVCINLFGSGSAGLEETGPALGRTFRPMYLIPSNARQEGEPAICLSQSVQYRRDKPKVQAK